MYSLRPSRLWPHVLKYYFLGVIFSLPFIINFFKESGSTTVDYFITNLMEFLSGYGISTGFLDFFSGFDFYMFILGILFFVIAELKRLRLKYNIYEDRVVRIRGLIIHHIKDVSYDHIDSYYTRRSIPERIFGTADLVLQTPTHKKSMVLKGLNNPEKWAEYIIKRAGLWD